MVFIAIDTASKTTQRAVRFFCLMGSAGLARTCCSREAFFPERYSSFAFVRLAGTYSN